MKSTGTQEAAVVTKQQETTASERFTTMMMQQYSQAAGAYNFTQREKALIRGYFITIDEMLKKAEAERIRKNLYNKDHKFDNPIPYTWNTVDLNQLAQDLSHYARIGLDMQEDNHLNPIPYKDNKGDRYTITLMEGYNGIRYQAEKYAHTPPKNVTVEVVYENDTFTPIKKGKGQEGDTYMFEVPQPFNRGKVVGAFGFIEYEDQSKNTLVVMSRADILKRKPRYASAEFWGGEKVSYKDGQRVTETLEGWEAEMFEKTMKREIYSAKRIPRDPAKVDESYHYIRAREAQYAQIAIENDAALNANTVDMGLPEAQAAIPETTQPEPEMEPETAPQEAPADKAQPEPKADKPSVQQRSFTEKMPWEPEPTF